MSHIMDDSYELMSKFMKTLHDQHQGIGNIYVAKTVDKHGNVTDVKYGKNMMTDHGMSEYFVSNKEFPTNMYIGQGSTDIGFNHTTCEILDRFDCVSTLVSATRDYAYPMYYDKVSGLVTVVCKALQVKFPLNISGISDDIRITEYGIGTAWDKLWTHSWVYATDDQGTVTTYGSIVKHPEEELYIDVYYCLSYYESLILDNWTNGRYTLITTMNRFFNHMNAENIYLYRRDNIGVSISSTTAQSGFDDNEITKYRNISEFNMSYTWGSDDTNNRKNGYFDGFCDWCSGFMSIERETRALPEAFTSIITPDGHRYNCLSNRFGKFNQESLPLSQANILSSTMYNPTTHEWDNSETFLNDSNKWYTETPLENCFMTPIYYTNNNTVMRLNVFQNINTHDPITAFNINVETVYAAEKYWDKETWHLISNLTNVPASDTNSYGHTMNCRTARYYISSTSDANTRLIPTRTSEGFVIIPTNGRSETYNVVQGGTEFYKASIASYDYHWYKHGNNIYCPYDHTQYSYADVLWYTDAYNFVYGKWLIMIQTRTNTTAGNRYYNSICYMDMSNLSTKPSVQLLTMPFDSHNDVDVYTQCYSTETGTGFITLQSLNYNISYVAKFKTNTPSYDEYATTKMCGIWGTNKIAYILANDTSHIQVYDYDTSSIVQTFDVPSGVTPAILFGHSNYVYIVSTVDSAMSFCCNITTGEITTMDGNMTNIKSTTQRVCMTAVDTCLVIYRYDQFNYENHYYINMVEPTKFHPVPQLRSYDQYYTSNVVYTLRKVHGNSVALIRNMGAYYYNNSGGSGMVTDFGNAMDGNIYTQFSSNTYQWIPYGDYIIMNKNQKEPLEHWMPHKITGTTPCISTINTIKNIRNKQFQTKFTNIPEFNGRPPGKRQ